MAGLMMEETSLMTVSLARRRFKVCDARKTSLGRFHTLGGAWLLPQVLAFLDGSGATVVLDPFAGAGDLLRTVGAVRPGLALRGCDKDAGHEEWKANDSLVAIAAEPGTILVTNPPHLAKHSAKRKGVLGRVERYYRIAGRSDLYQVALDACRAAARQTIAIVPETILRSGMDLSGYRHITIVLERLFADTEQPVVVACLDREWTAGPDIYLGARRLGALAELLAVRCQPQGNETISFNVRAGQIGLRAVDLPTPSKPIAFLPAAELGYPDSGIKVSSRLVTYLAIDPALDPYVPELCRRANRLLAEIRQRSHDVALSPFKGNTRDGRRRRRLDYRLARAILERAIREIREENSTTKNTKSTKNTQ